MNPYSTTFLALITCIFVKQNLGVDLNNLDPLDALIRKYNDGLTDKKINDERKKCTDIANIDRDKDHETLFFRPEGYLKYGEKCDPNLQRQFYWEFRDLSDKKPKDFVGKNYSTNLDTLSPKAWLSAYSELWTIWATKDEFKRMICNPRYFLECGYKSNHTYTCKCMHTGLKDEGGVRVDLRRQTTRDPVCNATGKCSRTTGIGTKRCIAAPAIKLKTKQDGKSHSLNSCEILLPPFGKCGVDCDDDAVCQTVPTNVTIGKVNSRFQDLKVCYKGPQKDGGKKRSDQAKHPSSFTVLSLLIVICLSLIL